VKVTDGKVAQIITATEFAINVGADHGVQQDDEVLLLRPVQVKDPDNGEVLGTVNIRFLSGKVSMVQEKLSVVKVTDRLPPRAGQRVGIIRQVTDDKMRADVSQAVLLLPGTPVRVDRSAVEEEPF